MASQLSQGRVATIDGAKAIVIGDRIVKRDALTRSIEALRKRAEEDLPAARAKLDGARLLEQAQANIDRQIEHANSAKSDLARLLTDFDKA